ncbi:MAG: glutathionylspermidine synthase family protein [Candidatus Omnitrophica bacterium]|nr:glutathionylspermidine synthase family protein [Candidatus Omnitrophota bacterium]
MREPVMRNVDHAYDQYLLAHEKDALHAIQAFAERMEKSHVKYGKFAIPVFFKPHFLTPRQEKLIKSASETLLGIVNKVVDLYFSEPELAGLFRIPEDIRKLMSVDHGYSKNVVVARFDAMLEGESLKFFELNTGSPAGMGYADALEEMIFSAEELKPFIEGHHIRKENRSARLLTALLQTYEDFGGHEKPQIAIVDWRTVKTRPEFEALKVFFEDKGYATVIADPRDLRYKGGKLYHDDFRIDILYRRVIFEELVEKLDEVEDMIKAYRNRHVCMVNPLRSKLAGSKAVLSLLTNPGYDRFFTAEENRVKANHLPWTRRIEDAERFYGGKKIYLIDFLKDEKETLVLKPSEGYNGKDVTIGCETREEDWNRAIDRALKGDWVVQEFVPIPVITVPVVVNSRLDFAYKKINFNSFVLGSKYAGSFSRVSDDSVINVARNGGLMTALTVEEVHER